jgi:hypothetical protein
MLKRVGFGGKSDTFLLRGLTDVSRPETAAKGTFRQLWPFLPFDNWRNNTLCWLTANDDL